MKRGNSFIAGNLTRALIFFSAFIWIAAAFAQPAPTAVFLSPDPQGASPFWTQVIEVMHAVAEDLEIDLQVIYSRSNSYSLKKDGLEILNNLEKSDFLLTGYWIAATHHHIKHADKLGIHTFVFNSGVIPQDRDKIGRPREKYRHWIGQMVPDDLQAGYVLADKLINQAKAAGKTDKAGKVHLINVEGFGDGIETARINGLTKRIEEQNDIILEQVILAGWSQTTAYNELLKALDQYAETGVIWSISDVMALGAIRASKDLEKQPGKDIFIGGMDWSPEGLKAIEAGEMAASMGGHFLEGALALILIHDYHFGFDFANELGVEIQTQMRPITFDNVGEFLKKLGNSGWRKIDFRQFSKKYNADLKSYSNLTLDALLESLEP